MSAPQDNPVTDGAGHNRNDLLCTSWPDLQQWLRTKEGPEPIVECVICRRELIVWGLNAPRPDTPKDSQEELSVFACGHLIGKKCGFVMEKYLESWFELKCPICNQCCKWSCGHEVERPLRNFWTIRSKAHQESHVSLNIIRLRQRLAPKCSLCMLRTLQDPNDNIPFPALYKVEYEDLSPDRRVLSRNLLQDWILQQTLVVYKDYYAWVQELLHLALVSLDFYDWKPGFLGWMKLSREDIWEDDYEEEE